MTFSHREVDAAGGRRPTSLKLRMEDACAPVLCRKHNGELSAADREAVSVFRRLRAAHRPSLGRIYQTANPITVDGRLFGRFLCKLYCGSVAAAGRAPNAEFIRHAFACRPSRGVWFLFPMARLTGVRSAAVAVNVVRTDEGEGFDVYFDGLHVLVSTIGRRERGFEELVAGAFPPGTEFQDRPEIVTMREKGREIRLFWDWADGPVP